MNVIRDEEMAGILMIPLFADWNVRRCNIEGCREKPTTIITDCHPAPVFGMCEEHYQDGVKAGSYKMRLEFDDYDAFREVKK